MKLSQLGFLFILVNLTSAFRLSLHGRRNAPEYAPIHRRGNLTPLNNSGDISYYANLTLGGVQFTVLIDTGSSDLWVAGSVPNSQATGHQTSVQYAVGAVQGPIKTAPLQFVGYNVSNQAFIQVVPDNENLAGTGLVGLGPNTGSNVFRTLNSTAGDAVLDRIFLQDPSTPNYITFNLSRSEDPTDHFPGELTIGEILPGFEAVTNQPELNVTNVPVFDVGDQHFQILLDANGLIGPDGNVIPIRTAVDQTQNKQQATAVVDTGFSLSQVPKSVADAIYGQFSGAESANVAGIGTTWIVPCSEEVNITFKFGGQSYPIDPLDATLDPTIVGLTGVVNSKGQPSCIGTFQPFSFDSGTAPTYDMILGMSFIRNVYALINFGDFITGSTNRAQPYIQFLSTTNPSKAHSDFVQVRLNGVDSTQNHLSPNKNSPSNSSHRVYYILLAVAGTVALIFSAIFFVIRARKSSPTKGGAAWGSYRPLQDPVDLHVMPTQQPYDPPQFNQAQYNPPQFHPQNLYNAQPYQQPYDPQSHNPNVPYQSPWDQRR